MHELETQVASFIKRKNLLQDGEKVLIALSGGRDSMTLMYVLRELGYSIGIAHCNFGLRSDESDKDEEFVVQQADKLGIPIWVKKFSEEDFRRQGNSVQVVARELRYQWFLALAKEQQFEKIAVAHHASDAIETTFINLIRGTGLRGMGIKPFREDRVVRPLLNSSNELIDQYVADNKIPYREDSSNHSDKYVRNKLRHHVLPNLFDVRENSDKGLMESLHILSDSQKFVDEQIEGLRQKHQSLDGNHVIFDVSWFNETNSGEFILFEWLRPYGFNKQMINNMFEGLNKESSQEYNSDHYEAIVKNQKIILRKIDNIDAQTYTFSKQINEINEPIQFKINKLNSEQVKSFEKMNNIAYFDFHKVADELVIRRWKEADWFIPLGMNGKRKLSDFFVDRKLNKFQKQNAWLLESNGEIIWIVGMQQNNTAKIDNSTSQVLRIEYIK